MKQPDPKPGMTLVAPTVLETLETACKQHVDYIDLWPWLKKRMETRIEAGRVKYGTLLETHNGRDALEDAWQEAADLVQYLTQAWLEGAWVQPLVADAHALLLKLSRAIWEREHKWLCLDRPEPVNDQIVYGPRPQLTPEIDEWAGWKGASEPE